MKGRGLERDLKMGEDMSDGERQIDTAAAAAYEEHLVAKVFGPWAERVVEIAAPIPGEAVLDAACGTGAGARGRAKGGARRQGGGLGHRPGNGRGGASTVGRMGRGC